MRKGLLITLPRYDDTTEYLSQFSQQIEKGANEKGVELKSLKDKEVTQKEFEKIIKNWIIRWLYSMDMVRVIQ